LLFLFSRFPKLNILLSKELEKEVGEKKIKIFLKKFFEIKKRFIHLHSQKTTVQGKQVLLFNVSTLICRCSSVGQSS
jgi:hypothetical protein